jgi:hypothetical protein
VSADRRNREPDFLTNRNDSGMCSGHSFEDADDLAGVSVFVVVPDVEDEVAVVGDGREPVDDSRAVRADEVAGDDFGGFDVVDLLPQP